MAYGAATDMQHVSMGLMHAGSGIADAPRRPPSAPQASDAQSRIFDMKDPRCASAPLVCMQAAGWLRTHRPSCTPLCCAQKAQLLHMLTDCGMLCKLLQIALTNADSPLSCLRRQELNNLLPEEIRRFDVSDRSYISAQPNYVSEQMLRTPPPKRITVKEEVVDQKADPVTGYARLGYVGQVQNASRI